MCPHKSQKCAHTCKHTHMQTHSSTHSQEIEITKISIISHCFSYTAMGENNGNSNSFREKDLSQKSDFYKLKAFLSLKTKLLCVCGVFVCIYVLYVESALAISFIIVCIIITTRVWQRQWMVSVAQSPVDGVKGFPPLLLSGLKRAVEA